MHVTDPVVHVRVQWITETQKDPVDALVGLGSAAFAAAEALIIITMHNFRIA